MSQALALAARGRGRVEPNPMVGCVLVKNGRVVGRGYHRRFGGPHAEVEALCDAGRAVRGATAFVTLEPCCHFGKTPPCADALIAAGVKRVVAAMQDPNPWVSGKGIKTLRAGGIRCDVGLMAKEAACLNAPFIKYHVQRRPYVILKWGQSIDGKIATRTSDSKWITSPLSRKVAHELRARVDGIIVGVNTVLADDPELTARHVRPLRTATRIVLDPHLRTPPRAKIVRTARKIPTLIVCREDRMNAGTARRLRRAGCEVVAMTADRRGIRLESLLGFLRERQMTNVLVEGGGRVFGSFVERRLADEAHVFVASRLIGGETAPGPLRNIGPATLKASPPVGVIGLLHLGGDICYTVRFG